MLDVCYDSELRPESAARAGRVLEPQADHFREVLPATLGAAVAPGVLRLAGDRYVLADAGQRSPASRFASVLPVVEGPIHDQLLKHIVTFVNWLPYIARKVEGHSGRRLELTLMEGKTAILFLWSRVIYVLLTRPRKEIGS